MAIRQHQARDIMDGIHQNYPRAVGSAQTRDHVVESIGRARKKQKLDAGPVINLLPSDEESSPHRHTSSQFTQSQGRSHCDTPTDNIARQHSSRLGTSVSEYNGVEAMIRVPRFELGKEPSFIPQSDDEQDELSIDHPPHKPDKIPRKFGGSSNEKTNTTPKPDHTKEFSPHFAPSNSLQDSFRDKDGNRRGTSLAKMESPDALQDKQATITRARAKPRGTKKASDQLRISETFSLQAILCLPIPTDYPSVCVTVDQEREKLFFSSKDNILEGGDFIQKPIKKIIRASTGEEKIFLEFSTDHREQRNKVFLHFCSHKSAFDFQRSLQVIIPDISITIRGDEWIQKAWDRQIDAPKRNQGLQRGHERSSSLSRPNDTQIVLTTASAKRSSGKMVDRMLSTADKMINPLDSKAGDINAHPNVPSQNHEISTKQLPIGYGTTIKPLQTTTGTRLRPRKEAVAIDGDDRDESSVPGFSQTGALGPKWSKPLLYPQSGTKRAEVEFDDLQRLDDDEFLNDNLVGFFLRYIQKYLEDTRPEICRQIYFFNTFFFQTLNKNIKGKRGINYDGVKKWTRGVDIFSKDFVVVPINESAHWFLAIICNLSGLKRRMLGTDDDEDLKHFGKTTLPSASPQVVVEQIPKSATSNSDLNLPLASAMDVDELNEKNREGVENLSFQTPTHPPPAKSSTGSTGKKRGQPKKRFDPQTPSIIILDSLPAIRRDSAVSSLKDYVKAEAEDKRSMRVERHDLQGTAAQEIPKQSNYSDCGLYLLAYVEKFAADPQNFVASILQKDMRKVDWSEMASSDLRSRLRNLILKLHQAQDTGEVNPNLPILGNTLLPPMKLPGPRNISPSTGNIAQNQGGNRKSIASPHHQKLTFSNIESPTETRSKISHQLDANGSIGLPAQIHEAQDSVIPKKRNMKEGVIRHDRVVIEDVSLLDQLEEAIARDSSIGPSRRSSVDTEAMASNKLFEKSLKRKREAEQQPSQPDNTDSTNPMNDEDCNASDAQGGKDTSEQELENAVTSPDELGDSDIDVNFTGQQGIHSTVEAQTELKDEIPETQSADDMSEYQAAEDVSETQSIEQVEADFATFDDVASVRPGVNVVINVRKHSPAVEADPPRVRNEVIEIDDDDDDEEDEEKDSKKGNVVDEDEMLLDNEQHRS